MAPSESPRTKRSSRNAAALKGASPEWWAAHALLLCTAENALVLVSQQDLHQHHSLRAVDIESSGKKNYRDSRLVLWSHSCPSVNRTRAGHMGSSSMAAKCACLGSTRAMGAA